MATSDFVVENHAVLFLVKTVARCLATPQKRRRVRCVVVRGRAGGAAASHRAAPRGTAGWWLEGVRHRGHGHLKTERLALASTARSANRPREALVLTAPSRR
jgi:hypothetical protein